MTDALRELLAKTKAQDNDGAIQIAESILCQHNPVWLSYAKALHNSMDAADRIHRELLPQWSIVLHGGRHGAQDYACALHRLYPDNSLARHTGRSAVKSQAWLIAIIQANIEDIERADAA
jgi:hypothetical protein